MTPEMEFRKDIGQWMKGRWRMTWHEDREINPGVPDISYVMLPRDYETGWLELKAIRQPKTDNYKFTVEPSQHEWISLHAGLVPVHFLMRAGEHIWLVEGKHHLKLMAPHTLAELNQLGFHMFNEDKLIELPANLALATHRRRCGI